MPILSLPEGTVRQLGAAPVLNSPVALLKELVDNAIDSGALSVDVLVSPNTVDKIEVRDNGHGIQPADFMSLGRPGHTSKLRSFEELGTLGRSTLGFRGAALASACSLARVSIVTRVFSEPAATALRLAETGGIETQRLTGAPVGTTVSATDLFLHLPVRRQVAVAGAPKTLVRMRDLLQSYAFARPQIRLRFTVLKTPNLSWTYAPAPDGGIKEVALQLFGTAFAAQCTFETFPDNTACAELESNTPTDSIDGSHQEASTVTFEALLPEGVGADPRVVNKGAFFSVDSRPISPSRPTARKLYSIFKRLLGKRFSQSHSDYVPREPFIRLNIRCPSGSYDVNIEPSKEDVLFKEEQRLLDQFEAFLVHVYDTAEENHSPSDSNAAGSTTAETPGELVTELASHRVQVQHERPSWRVDMSSGLDGDDTVDEPPQQNQHGDNQVETEVPEEENADEDGGEQPSKEGLNPWSIAKLISTSRRSDEAREPQLNDRRQAQPQPADTNPEEGHGGRSPPATQASGLDPPSSSDDYGGQGEVMNAASRGRTLRNVLGREHQTAVAPSAWPSSRQVPTRRSNALQSPPTSSPREEEEEEDVPRHSVRRRRVGGPGRLVQSQIPFDKHAGRQRRHEDQTFQPREGHRRMRKLAPAQTVSVQEATIADRGHREMDAGWQRGELAARPRHRPPSHGAPDMYEAPRMVSAPVGADEEMSRGEKAPIGDPRACLIRQHSLALKNPQEKLRRLKTEQLPLETIPHGFETCAFVLTMGSDTEGLARMLHEASRFDTWLVDGELGGALQDGTNIQDAAALVQPLLAGIGQGITMGA